MTCWPTNDDRRDDVVPPPLDTRIPTDDELDALCDEMMRFEADGELAERPAAPRTVAGT